MSSFSYNLKIPSLSDTEKYLLCTGYGRQYYKKYITKSIIQLFMKYSNHIYSLNDIKQFTPNSQFETKVFDMFGCKWYLKFLQNGDPNDFKHNPYEPNVFTVRNSNQPHNHMVYMPLSQAEDLGLITTVMVTGTRSVPFVRNGIPLSINHGDIVMNEVACKNIGCRFGDKVSVTHAPVIPYGKSITLSAVIDTADSAHSISHLQPYLIMNYLQPYFANILGNDRYSCKIGDCYTIWSMFDDEPIEFQVVEMEVADYELYQNICIVNHQTIIALNAPITSDAVKIHLDQPQIQLHLFEWGRNITKIDVALIQVTIQELGEQYIAKHSESWCLRTFTMTFDEYRKVFKWTNAKITMQDIQDLDSLTFTLDFERIGNYKKTGNVVEQKSNHDNDVINIDNAFSGIPLKLNEDNKKPNSELFDEICQLKGKKLICNESDKMSRIKIIYIDGTNETLKVNLYTTIKQLYIHTKFTSGYETGFELMGGVPPKSLEDLNATIKDTKLMGSRIIQKAIGK